MGPLAVVDLEPRDGDRPQLRDRFEEMRVEHFGPVAPVETFDVRVLIGFARLDVVHGDAVVGAPVDEGLGGEFRAVVDPHCRRPSVHRHELVEHTRDRRLGSDGPMAISKPSRFPSSITVSSRTRRLS